jgi:hypothetical protein
LFIALLVSSIESEIELPGLPPAPETQETPVRLTLGDVPESLPNAQAPNENLQVHEGESLLMTLPGFGRMLIHAGREDTSRPQCRD